MSFYNILLDKYNSFYLDFLIILLNILNLYYKPFLLPKDFLSLMLFVGVNFIIREFFFNNNNNKL